MKRTTLLAALVIQLTICINYGEAQQHYVSDAQYGMATGGNADIFYEAGITIETQIQPDKIFSASISFGTYNGLTRITGWGPVPEKAVHYSNEFMKVDIDDLFQLPAMTFICQDWKPDWGCYCEPVECQPPINFSVKIYATDDFSESWIGNVYKAFFSYPDGSKRKVHSASSGSRVSADVEGSFAGINLPVINREWGGGEIHIIRNCNMEKLPKTP
jgi:hypothetical protein